MPQKFSCYISVKDIVANPYYRNQSVIQRLHLKLWKYFEIVFLLRCILILKKIKMYKFEFWQKSLPFYRKLNFVIKIIYYPHLTTIPPHFFFSSKNFTVKQNTLICLICIPYKNIKLSSQENKFNKYLLLFLFAFTMKNNFTQILIFKENPVVDKIK